MFRRPLTHNILFYRGVTLVLLFGCCLMIHLLSRNKEWVEHHYSTEIYPHLASVHRIFTGWIPFSIGDVMYALLIIYLLWFLIRLFLKRKTPPLHPKWYKIIIATGLIYIFFNIAWGLNYNRIGIAHQLGLKMHDYSKEELVSLNYMLLNKLNHYKNQTLDSAFIYKKKRDLFNESIHSYVETAKKYPFLKYRNPSLKPSLFSYAGNYLGFLGYYNPFSGEAQVNTTVPKFLQPYTSCHEIAHQLGYAKEMEANFVAYLAAKNSKNHKFHYSLYFDLFRYANRNLYQLDSLAAKGIREELSPTVKKDFADLRDFYKRYGNYIEPIVRWGYDKFLLSNQQPQGIMSYDEVTSFLIAYYRKFGEI